MACTRLGTRSPKRTTRASRHGVGLDLESRWTLYCCCGGPLAPDPHALLVGRYRLYPDTFFATLVVSFPLFAIRLLLPPPEVLSTRLLILAADFLNIYLLARTMFWLPLIVDAKIPLVEAFQTTWASTQGLIMRIFGLGVVLALPTIPAIVLDVATKSTHFYVTSSVSNLFQLMGMAVLYVVTWDDHPGNTDRRCGVEGTRADSGLR